MPNYDVDKGLRIKNFIHAKDNNGLCLLCHWYVDNINFNDHVQGYHHQSLLMLHTRWIENKKAALQFGIIDSEKVADDTITSEKVTEDVEPEVKGDGVSEEIYDKTETCENDENVDTNNVRPNIAAVNDNDKVCGEPISTNSNAEEEEPLPQVDEPEETVQSNGTANANGETSGEKAETTGFPKSQKSSKKKNKAHKEYKINTSINNNIVIRKNKDAQPVPADEPSEEEIEKTKALADEYEVKIKPDGATMCAICNSSIGGTYEEIEAHISSIKHKKKYFSASKISPNNYDVMRMEDYHKRSLMSFNIIRSFMVVNGEFCIHLLSYQVFVKTPVGLQCFLCDKTIKDCQQHFMLDLHKRLFGNCLVITSFKNEFVREVSPLARI